MLVSLSFFLSFCICRCHDWFLVDLPGYLFPLVDSHAEPTALQEDVVEEIASVSRILLSRLSAWD